MQCVIVLGDFTCNFLFMCKRSKNANTMKFDESRTGHVWKKLLVPAFQWYV